MDPLSTYNAVNSLHPYFSEIFIMLCNLGIVDRIARIVIGSGMIALVYYGPKTPWGWFGIIPLTTSILCFCPVYGVLGVKTCKKKKP